MESLVMDNLVKRVKSLILAYRELIGYCLIGGSGVIVDFSVFTLFQAVFGLHYQGANFISFSVANLSNFLLNAFLNFKVKDRLLVRFFGFYGVGLFSWFLSANLLYIFFERLGISVYIAKMITLVLVTAVQFTLNKFVTFRKRGAQK